MNLWRKFLEKLKKADGARGYACDSCGAELFDYPTHRLCGECEEKLLKTGERFCEKCGRQTRAEGVCLTCKTHAPKYTRAFSPFPYLGTAAKLVNRMKNGEPRLALYFGERMAEYFLSQTKERELLVLSVPTTQKRKKARGYNQAEELAESVAAALEAAGASVTLDHEVLQKTRENFAQKKLGFDERAKNIAGAFHLHKRNLVQEKTVLLIDDIMTTGATGSACAALMINAGAKAVYFLTAVATPELK
ncbi:MAG: ComF family protein [Clostridia bacterium]|nr:ComF family protein [Clostridia bacterium]